MTISLDDRADNGGRGKFSKVYVFEVVASRDGREGRGLECCWCCIEARSGNFVSVDSPREGSSKVRNSPASVSI